MTWPERLEANAFVLLRAYATSARIVKGVQYDIPMVEEFLPSALDWNVVYKLEDHAIKEYVFAAAYKHVTGEFPQDPITRWGALQDAIDAWRTQVLSDAKRN